jgi:hypothetical protein
VNVWRLGHRENPCDFIPRNLSKWHHRFDDPLKRYRTLYCAEQSITCLRELLADLRPNRKALSEFEELFSDSPEESFTVAGVVSSEWRLQHVLVKAEVKLLRGSLVDVEMAAQLKRLAHIHRDLLKHYGIDQLDISQIRSQERIITQKISRTLFEEMEAGVKFRSRLDQLLCFALFEGRASLSPVEAVIPMTTDHPDLVHVCGEFTLVLRPGVI